VKRLLALLSVCLLLVTGCANIPLESQPQVVSGDKPAQAPIDVPEPAAGIDPLTVARQFVRASALPSRESAAARVYLDDESRRTWKPAPGMTIDAPMRRTRTFGIPCTRTPRCARPAWRRPIRTSSW
jgi:hypothetical protein